MLVLFIVKQIKPGLLFTIYNNFLQFFLFAVLAVAFANPKPDPQLLAYSAASYPVAYTGYGAAPLAYSAGYAPYPYGYSAYYVR